MTKPTKLSLCPLAPIDGDFSETRPLEIDGFLAATTPDAPPDTRTHAMDACMPRDFSA